MKSSRSLFVPAFLIAGALIAQDAQVTLLMSKDLADFPGKEGLMINRLVFGCSHQDAHPAPSMRR